MGFLRVRTIKNSQYFYWSSRTRSSKKHGGSGKVRSIELLIGNYLSGKYLPFYLWTGEIPVQDYASEMIAFSCPEAWQKLITAEIDWRAKPKVILRSVQNAQGYQADCRSTFWRKQKRELQKRLDAIIFCSNEITETIEFAAYFLSRHESLRKDAAEERATAVEIRKDPDKEWTETESVKDPCTGNYHQEEVTYSWEENADLAFDEEAAESERKADLAIEYHQEKLDAAVKYAPAKRRKEFQTLAMRQVKKLAADNRWVNAFGKKAREKLD